ncbi:MAG: thiamine diphosphokinase [Acidimicrobiales bacterium]|nr:thiamine diphosphokinase [Acidimicrobiales bacterium]MDP6900959.1 thiamine diphosphokinase [Acidimicrobiales bacterium]HJL98749.1 thiamine diphosphokinase [Acidimicrobiales bacterium]
MSRYSLQNSSFDPTRTWVIDGGPNLPSLPNIEPPTLVIAADVGYLHARHLGIQVDAVVGDLDSLGRENLETVNSQLVVEEHPEDKDESDLALALSFARTVGATNIDIITGGGGRLDHLLVSSMLLASEENIDQRIVTHCGASRVLALKPGKAFDLVDVVGSQVSIIALKSDSRISTTGLRWNLSLANAVPTFSSLGLSNEIIDHPTIDVVEGVFLVIVTSRDL